MNIKEGRGNNPMIKKQKGKKVETTETKKKKKKRQIGHQTQTNL